MSVFIHSGREYWYSYKAPGQTLAKAEGKLKDLQSVYSIYVQREIIHSDLWVINKKFKTLVSK